MRCNRLSREIIKRRTRAEGDTSGRCTDVESMRLFWKRKQTTTTYRHSTRRCINIIPPHQNQIHNAKHWEDSFNIYYATASTAWLVVGGVRVGPGEVKGSRRRRKSLTSSSSLRSISRCASSFVVLRRSSGNA